MILSSGQIASARDSTGLSQPYGDDPVLDVLKQAFGSHNCVRHRDGLSISVDPVTLEMPEGDLPDVA